MNKIININLAGRSIPIDETAYSALSDYINWLRDYFSREKGGDEIVRDMEDRIGELFQEKLKGGYPCIMADDVRSMIQIMGSPEQIVQEAEGSFTKEENRQQSNPGSEGAQASDSNYINNEHKLSKSTTDKIIGGVCGGIANHYNIDPAIVRIAFALSTFIGGAGILIYIILWIVLPESNGKPIKTLRRKLFRNPEQKVFGGVCSGLAAYLRTDTIILRLIFLLPVLFSASFNWMGNWDYSFLPSIAGSIPTSLVLIYIIIWATVPEAKSVVQKLEMRGEKVDVQSVSESLNPDKKDDKQQVNAGRNRSSNFFAILIKIIAFFFLGIALIVLASIAVSIVAAVFGVAISGFAFMPYMHLVTDSTSMQWLLWSSVLVIFVIPLYAIVKLIVRIISGRKRQSNRWLDGILVILFLAALICIGLVAGSIINDFRARAAVGEDVAIQQPANDTLIIAQRDNYNEYTTYRSSKHFNIGLELSDSMAEFGGVRVDFVKSPDSLFHIVTYKNAYGKTPQRAERLTGSISYKIDQENNKLYIPEYIRISKNEPYRAQSILIQVQVPEKGVFKTENLDDDAYERTRISVGAANINIRTTDGKSWHNGAYHKISETDSLSEYQHDDWDEDE